MSCYIPVGLLAVLSEEAILYASFLMDQAGVDIVFQWTVLKPAYRKIVWIIRLNLFELNKLDMTIKVDEGGRPTISCFAEDGTEGR